MGDKTESTRPEAAAPEAGESSTTPAEGPEDEVGVPTSPPAGAESAEREASKAVENARDTAPETTASPAKSAGRRRPRDPVLARSFRTHRPVMGKVDKTIKGGFEVRVGRTRAFCPFSQMELHRVENPDDYVGREFPFAVIQFRRGGEDVVLSRRALLEEDRSDEAKAVRATLLEGAVMWGRVASVADFGAFVDLGAGVTGLVHISEMGHARVQRVGDAVDVGDWVHVKVLKLDDSRGRISLSIRQAERDPWQELGERFKVGNAYPGRVNRITDFGAFVELAPGLEVLAPARDFPPTEAGWPHGLETGTEGRWLLTAVDATRRRATVVPAPEKGSLEPVKVEPGATLEGRVQRVEKFGVFVWLGHGLVGLIPGALTGVPRNVDLQRKFPVGRSIEVDVIDVSEENRRIRLAVKGVAPPPDRADRPRRPKSEAVEDAKPDEPQAAFGNSLADALKAALEKPR